MLLVDCTANRQQGAKAVNHHAIPYSPKNSRNKQTRTQTRKQPTPSAVEQPRTLWSHFGFTKSRLALILHTNHRPPYSVICNAQHSLFLALAFTCLSSFLQPDRQPSTTHYPYSVPVRR
ncbi:hypothetical protein CSIM01_10202 [Colletotrichum simmondsii]|uniref:Uncharacterized protein n=1 Tax=Colletotrichum simmondsii TaxID=703756 RepID=A0A135SHP5_9PEZI|nr:hypothetical protein CSIM01_10202 [Colletotrichum simmondsii]